MAAHLPLMCFEKGTSPVGEVEQQMMTQDNMLATLKTNLQQAQQRMVTLANKKRKRG